MVIHHFGVQPPVLHGPDGVHQHAVRLLAAVGDAGQADDGLLPGVVGASLVRKELRSSLFMQRQALVP